MTEIKKYNPTEAEALDSREVAEMVEKRHTDLLRDIRGYIEHMENHKEGAERKIASGDTEPKVGPSGTELKLEPSEFFIPSSYPDANGQKRPNFLITKKGCEFVANKLTGEKGTKFTALYVTRFNVMEEQEKQQTLKGKPEKTPEEIAAADKRATAMLLNAKNRTAANLQRLYDRAGVKAEYQALAISDFYAVDGIKLPRIALQGTKDTYDKGTIAKRLGIMSKSGLPHAQAVGAIIKQLDLTVDEVEVVPFARNGHDGTDYQYAESVVSKVKTWLEVAGYPAVISLDNKCYKVSYEKQSGQDSA